MIVGLADWATVVVLVTGVWAGLYLVVALLWVFFARKALRSFR